MHLARWPVQSACPTIHATVEGNRRARDNTAGTAIAFLEKAFAN